MMVLIEIGMGVLLIAVVVAAFDEAMHGRTWNRKSLARSTTPINSGDAGERADDAAA